MPKPTPLALGTTQRRSPRTRTPRTAAPAPAHTAPLPLPRQVRRKADPAKEQVREFVGKWRDNPAVASDASHDEIKGACARSRRARQQRRRPRLLRRAATGRVSPPWVCWAAGPAACLSPLTPLPAASLPRPPLRSRAPGAGRLLPEERAAHAAVGAGQGQRAGAPGGRRGGAAQAGGQGAGPVLRGAGGWVAGWVGGGVGPARVAACRARGGVALGLGGAALASCACGVTTSYAFKAFKRLHNAPVPASRAPCVVPVVAQWRTSSPATPGARRPQGTRPARADAVPLNELRVASPPAPPRPGPNRHAKPALAPPDPAGQPPRRACERAWRQHPAPRTAAAPSQRGRYQGSCRSAPDPRSASARSLAVRCWQQRCS
jgi:hypothetical protein